MADGDAAYARLGDLIWGRFRLLGVPDPRAATIRWCRDPANAWVGDGSRTHLTKLLLEVTDAGLKQRAPGKPPPAAAAMYLGSAGQIERVLEGAANLRKALLLSVADGLDTDEIATLLGMTATSVRFALNDVEDDLAELAEEPPEGSLEDGHLNTIQMHGFALEQLDDLQTEQYEQHLATCSSCFARFDAWSQNREAFEVLPAPAQPPKQRTRMLLPLVGCASMLVAILGAFTVSTLWLVQTAEETVKAATWDGSPPVVEIHTAAGEVPDDGVASGSVLQIWYDPKQARHVGFAVGVDGQLWEVLAVMPAGKGSGLRLAPVEAQAHSGGATSVWVFASERPISETGIREALRDGRADIVFTHAQVQRLEPDE